MHIDVEIQPFEFEAFEYTNVLFEFAGEQFDIVGLGIIPHTKKRKYKGKAILVDLNNSESRHTLEEIEGKTIISNDLKRHFGLARYKPGLIVYVDSLVFQKLKSLKAPYFNLHFDGEHKKYLQAAMEMIEIKPFETRTLWFKDDIDIKGIYIMRNVE